MFDLNGILTVALTVTSGALLLAAEPSAHAPARMPELSATASANASPQLLRPSYSENGRLFLTATLNGTATNFLIDTGSSHTVLSRSDAARLRVGRSVRVNVHTAGGIVSMQRGMVHSLIVDGAFIAQHPVLISDQIDTSLLGTDLLRATGKTQLSLTPVTR